MKRILTAEALGTLLLVAAVIGSGIMAERLSDGNVALALLANTVATGAMLYTLISLLGPISGAHFNPAVTILATATATGERGLRIMAQSADAIAGTILAHLMFGRALLEVGGTARTGVGQWAGEAVATFGLLLTIRLGARFNAKALPALIAAWIVAAYWFTSSTSFANPAVTLARAFSNSFAGIRPTDVPLFLLAQLGGAWAGNRLAEWLTTDIDIPSPLTEAMTDHEGHHLA